MFKVSTFFKFCYRSGILEQSGTKSRIYFWTVERSTDNEDDYYRTAN